jgi:hypothetical protein
MRFTLLLCASGVAAQVSTRCGRPLSRHFHFTRALQLLRGHTPSPGPFTPYPQPQLLRLTQTEPAQVCNQLNPVTFPCEMLGSGDGSFSGQDVTYSVTKPEISLALTAASNFKLGLYTR